MRIQIMAVRKCEEASDSGNEKLKSTIANVLSYTTQGLDSIDYQNPTHEP